MIATDEGFIILEEYRGRIPLTYTVVASKPAQCPSSALGLHGLMR